MKNYAMKLELTRMVDNLDQVAREIYYAGSLIKENKSEYALANLTRALNILGIDSPRDIGLSDRLSKVFKA